MSANEKLVNLDPDDIVIGDNVRYNLKAYRIDRLAEDILSHGGVQTPIMVEELQEAVDGKSYRLVFGHIRTEAVRKLNIEQHAGLTLPARVIGELQPAERLRLQASENNEREDMSPMDKAVAMQKMLAAGLSKMDIRKSFAAPGGRKGNKVQEVSNAHVNMMLSFLNFPKAIQNKIHDGLLPVNAAYELTKQPKEKWDAIMERAEAARIRQLDIDDKDENDYLSQSKKLSETEAKHEEASKALETAKAEHDKAQELANEKSIVVSEALKTRMAAKGEERKEADKHFKSVKAEFDSAQSVADEKAKEVKKLEDKATSAADKAQAAKNHLEQVRMAKAAKATKVTTKDVAKAAKDVGGNGKAGKLNAQEMRDAMQELIHNGKANTKMVGTLIEKCFSGDWTYVQLRMALDKIWDVAKPGLILTLTDYTGTGNKSGKK